MIFFTVVSNSLGGTVQLAWQGLAGTLSATFNIFVMSKLFPLGGKCTLAAHGMPGYHKPCAEYAYPNYGMFWWVVWIDLIGFTVLTLASNAQENTMKFGLSWHLCYMMSFMSASGYTPSHSVNITSCVGCILAIVVVRFPKSQSVTHKITEDPLTIASTVESLLQKSGDFMLKSQTLSRQSNAANRFLIQQKAESFDSVIDGMQANLSDSWWETFNAGSYYALRGSCSNFTEYFDDVVGGLDDALKTVWVACHHDETTLWRQCSSEAVERLLQQRKDCMDCLEEPKQLMIKTLNGLAERYPKGIEPILPSADELTELDNSTTLATAKYKELLEKGDASFEGYAERRLAANMNMYFFAVVTLGDKVYDFAVNTASNHEDAVSTVPLWRQIYGLVTQGLQATFDLRKFENHIDKRMFVLRNSLSITIAFMMGYFFVGGVYPGYCSNLAGTLALLISHYPGSAFYRNLMRLLGVTLGKILPILIMAFVSIFGKSGPLSETVHLISVWCYMAFFAYMSYTSPDWAYVGCLVAGFGCYTLVGTHADAWGKPLFYSRYQEIGQVTVAIMIQIVIDTVDTWWRSTFPRDVVTHNMCKLGQWHGRSGFLVQAFDAFFDGEFEKMKEMTAKAKTELASQQTLVSETAPKTVIAPGMRVSFKDTLYTQVLGVIQQLINYLDILYLIYVCEQIKSTTWHAHPIKWEKFGGEHRTLIKDVQKALETFQEVIAHGGEDRLEGIYNEAKYTEDTLSIPVTEIRATLVWRVLHECRNKCYDIEHLCYGTGAFN